MKVSKCCGAGFPEPGYPDTDLCGLCYEHTEAIEGEEPLIEVIKEINHKHKEGERK